MKRPRHILRIFWRAFFHSICAISLLLLIAVLCAWGQSYWLPRYWAYLWREPAKQSGIYYIVGFAESLVILDSSCGGLQLTLRLHEDPACYFEGFETYPYLRGSQFGHYPYITDTNRHIPQKVFNLRWVGATYYHEEATQMTLVAPHFLVALAAAILPYCWFHRLRRQHLAKAEGCPICHYDLRAHAPGQKCPECGTLIETSPPPRL